MISDRYLLLADIVLGVHVAIILFNLFGLIAIPLGGWRGWRFVRIFWWRALHVAILAPVALQAVLQEVCFLTLWQGELLRRAGQAASEAPLIARVVNRLILLAAAALGVRRALCRGLSLCAAAVAPGAAASSRARAGCDKLTRGASGATRRC